MAKLVAALETLCRSEADRRQFNADDMARAQAQEVARCTQAQDAREENARLVTKHEEKHAEAKRLEAGAKKTLK
jgi:hypothetical protein